MVVSFEAIGTQWGIEFFDSTNSDEALRLVLKRIEQFDQVYSRFRSDSLVTQMSQAAGSYQLPADAEPMLSLYHDLYKLSNGRVTPLIGQTLSDAGYDAAYSLKPKKLNSPPAWEDSIEYKPPQLKLYRPALLDFGALGKGYLIDLLADTLKQAGVNSFLINGGGDMLHKGTGRPVEIGLENPTAEQEVIGMATIQNQSLCGSAGNRRAWGNYHHILDPHTLNSPQHRQAVWVCADTALLADAMTTALFFVKPELLRTRYNFEYAIINEDTSLSYSPEFPATFFTEEAA